MQLSRIGVSLGVLMLLATTALAQKVTTDYAKGADFSQYKTFAWIKEPQAYQSLDQSTHHRGRQCSADR